jgi:uncharacterized damage-inducible protein DinB
VFRKLSFVKTLPAVQNSTNKEDLSRQIREVHQALVDFYSEIPDTMLDSEAIPDGWTVKRNMKHIISTNMGFAFWIGLPAFILRLFPKPYPNQPTVEEIFVSNRKGNFDYGKYAKPGRPHPRHKEQLLKAILFSSEKLQKSLAKRTEEELDTLPSIFGKMTIRTFLLFTIKHNIHHTNIVRFRLSGRL